MSDLYTLPYGKMLVDCSMFFNLARAARDLEILQKNYNQTKYGTIDKEVCEAVFGPKCPPAEAIDPEDVLRRALQATEKAGTVLVKLENSMVKNDA